MPLPRPNDERAAREREAFRARFRAATELAIGNFLDQAAAALGELRHAIDFADDEMAARYYLAAGVLLIKRRSIEEAFATLARAIAAARKHGDSGLLGAMLTNFGTAATQDGNIEDAIACLEEFERLQPSARRSFAGPMSMIEALLAAGSLRRAALLLHELYDRYLDTPALISAAAVGISLGIMLEDEALLDKGRDVTLLDLAFVRGEQWLIGPLVEAFCILYEREGLRSKHDELLSSAVDRMTTVDNSLPLAVRAARAGDARMLPRLVKMVETDCPSTSELHRARKLWFEGVVAERHGRHTASRRLATLAAQAFGNAKRPLLQAAALASAGSERDSDAVLRFCGATAFPVVRWTAAPTRHGTTELTARELEVATLAAKGLSNRAIAEALRVSERTVHRHCESVFRKLDIHSRWQLSAASLKARDGG